MRDTEPDHKCPVADKAPELFPENDLVVDVWQDCIHTAEHVTTEDDRTYVYLKATEVAAVMSLRGVPTHARQETFDLVLMCERIANELRPKRKRKRRRR